MPTPRKRKAPARKAKAVKAAEPDRFTEDGRKIVRLEKTRAHQKYPLKDGTDVPGASTIAKIGEDTSGLIHWAWKLGMEGQDYRKVRDKAADIGTVAHFMIECFLHNHEPDLAEFSSADIEKANIAFGNFRKWWDEEGFTVIEPEVQLVSEEYLFGGTIDAPSRDRDGKIVLVGLEDEQSHRRRPQNPARRLRAAVEREPARHEDPTPRHRAHRQGIARRLRGRLDVQC
jgi:hypothetical protein